MTADASPLTIQVIKPNSAPSLTLAAMGADVRPLVEDEGNVDRYVLSLQVAAERRGGTMFVQGIEDKSLFLSAIYLRGHFETPSLILEGELQQVRGILATFAVSDYIASDPDIDATVVDERAVIGVLKLLRQRRGVKDTAV